MTLKAIKYQTGYVFVDEETKIPVGGYGIHRADCYRSKYSDKDHIVKCTTDNYVFIQEHWCNIVAQTSNLTLPVPCVELEEDIEEIAVRAFPLPVPDCLSRSNYKAKIKRRGFIEGYKAAKAKQYSEEDRDRYALEQQIKTLTMLANVQPKEASEQTYRLISQFTEALHTLHTQVESIELVMEGVRDFMSEETFDKCFDKQRAQQLWDKYKPYNNPVTYQKDGREYYRIKNITYKHNEHGQS